MDESRSLEDAYQAWKETVLEPYQAKAGESKESFATVSEIPVERLYTPLDAPGRDYL